MSLKVIKFFQYLAWGFSKFTGKFFLNLEIKGLENLKNLETGGVIFAANHFGRSDPFLIVASLPFVYFCQVKSFRYMTFYKYALERWYAPIIRLLGAYPVFPGRGNLDEALKDTETMLKDKQNILIFPTAKIRKYFNPNEARPGVAHLAKKLNSVIMPVFIKNTYHIEVKEFFLRKRNIVVIFGKPFRYQEVATENEDLSKAAIKIMERVGEATI